MDDSFDALKARFVEVGERFRQGRFDAPLPEGVTTAEARALRCLRRLEEKGSPARPGLVAGALRTSPSAFSQTLRSLEAKGWVERRRAPGEDSRAVQVVLTEAGQRIEEVCRKKREERLDAILRCIGPEDLAVMTSALERVVEMEESLRTKDGEGPCA